jgi:GntR family transcriptional repressor for pyruvate dehydrogenase complex
MTRLHEDVARSLLAAIVADEIAVGDWLPREVDLADRFGISRGTAREVVHSLRLRGVIDVRHGQGAWVQAEDRWNLLDPDVLRAGVLVPGRAALLNEVIECRAMFEPEAAALAAERAQPEDVGELLQHVDAMREARSPQRRGAAAEDARIGAEAAFHDRLAVAARNRPMRRMLEPVHLALATARHVITDSDQDATLRAHERIARAVERHDPAAARRAITADVNALTRALEQAQRPPDG